MSGNIFLQTRTSIKARAGEGKNFYMIEFCGSSNLAVIYMLCSHPFLQIERFVFAVVICLSQIHRKGLSQQQFSSLFPRPPPVAQLIKYSKYNALYGRKKRKHKKPFLQPFSDASNVDLIEELHRRIREKGFCPSDPVSGRERETWKFENSRSKNIPQRTTFAEYSHLIMILDFFCPLLGCRHERSKTYSCLPSTRTSRRSVWKLSSRENCFHFIPFFHACSPTPTQSNLDCAKSTARQERQNCEWEWRTVQSFSWWFFVCCCCFADRSLLFTSNIRVRSAWLLHCCAAEFHVYL